LFLSPKLAALRENLGLKIPDFGLLSLDVVGFYKQDSAFEPLFLRSAL